MAFGTPPAYMGFMGFVRFQSPAYPTTITRATSADLRLSQEITKPDVIDGRWDKTVYQLGPMIVEGTIEFPSIMVQSGLTSQNDPTAVLYRAAVGRQFTGELAGRLRADYLFDIDVLYTTSFAAFRYRDCIVNQWRFTAAQSDVVTISADIIGRSRETRTIEQLPALQSSATDFPQNSRIVTWQDVRVNITGAGDGTVELTGDYIRNFEAIINNDAERYYTFNGLLLPQDIAARKRDIDGTMTLMGRYPQLGEYAFENQTRCNETHQLVFGYDLTNTDCLGTFLVTLPNIVFEIEEMSLTNDIFETTVNWHCLPNANNLEHADYLTDTL